MPDGPPTKVECNECEFSRLVRPSDDELPGEVVIRHGTETGHRLSLSGLDRDQLSGSGSPRGRTVAPGRDADRDAT